MLRWFRALLFWTIIVVGIGGIVGLLALTGYSEIRQNWAAGEPWFSGFQAASVAVPIAALIAAGVAITTARWALSAERDRRDIERRDTTERALRDRFHELVKLLAAEELRAREGAAFAVAALADDWQAHYRNEPNRARAEQQVCIDVLISQLRDPMPADEAAYAHMVAFKHSVQGIFRSRLGTDTAQPGVWTNFNLVFDGCTFHDLDLTGCVSSGRVVSFRRAQFIGEAKFDFAHFTWPARFDSACFTRGARFSGARFTRLAVFGGAHFAGAATFDHARFAGDAVFGDTHFTGPTTFDHARFAVGAWFGGAHFTGSARFNDARFAVGAWFGGAHFTGPTTFDHARFAVGAWFGGAHFTGETTLNRASFPGDAGFRDAHFASSRVSLENADFAGGPVWFGDTYFDVLPQEFPKCELCKELRARQVLARVPDDGWSKMS
ncbi:pentapeptide repeat protein [Dietzia kunjamensis]|nr:pentapeptide repeat protein [Dietzia kunjamensis]